MENQSSPDTSSSAADKTKKSIPRHDSGEFQSPELMIHFVQSRKLSLLFSTRNWPTGWHFWLRTTLPIVFINILVALLITEPGQMNIANLGIIILNLVFLQIVGKRFAADRYNIQVRGTFCWSVFWRSIGLLFVYVIVVSFVVTILFAAGMEEFLGLLVFPIGIMYEPVALAIAVLLVYISLILLQVAIFGIVVNEALEISYKKNYRFDYRDEELPDWSDEAGDEAVEEPAFEPAPGPVNRWDS